MASAAVEHSPALEHLVPYATFPKDFEHLPSPLSWFGTVTDNDASTEARIIKVHAPGLNAGDIRVHVDGNTLLVSGEHKSTAEEKRDTEMHSQFSSGSFKHSFTLSKRSDSSKIIASIDNGVIQVTIPNREDPDGSSPPLSPESKTTSTTTSTISSTISSSSFSCLRSSGTPKAASRTVRFDLPPQAEPSSGSASLSSPRFSPPSPLFASRRISPPLRAATYTTTGTGASHFSSSFQRSSIGGSGWGAGARRTSPPCPSSCVLCQHA